MKKGFPKSLYGTNNSSETKKVYQSKSPKVGTKRGGVKNTGRKVSKGGKPYGG